MQAYLASYGFEGELVLKKNLDFSQVYIEVKPPGNTWENTDEMFLYIYSPLFAKVMEALFHSKQSIAWTYLPRKLRKDTNGCLAMVCSGLKINKHNIQQSRLEPSNNQVVVSEFLNGINTIENEKELLISLFEGELSKLFVVIEGVWVYLFLAHQSELNISQTLQGEILKKSNYACVSARWRMRKPLDEKLIRFFFACCDRFSQTK